MADCEKLEKCPFFTGKMDALPNVSSLLKLTYCHSDKMQCARYRVSAAGIEVPVNLFPNDHERAQKILGISS